VTVAVRPPRSGATPSRQNTITARWLSESVALVAVIEPIRRPGVSVIEHRAPRGFFDLGVLQRGRGGFVHTIEGDLVVWSGGEGTPTPRGAFTYCAPGAAQVLEVASPDARFLLVMTDA
jgi:hypothetical protein